MVVEFLLKDFFEPNQLQVQPVVVAAKLSQLAPPVLAQRLLSAQEQNRSLRFRRTEDHKSYVTAHVLKKVLLHCVTGLPLSELRFRTDAGGKPWLETSHIAFSLSHTQGLAVVATSFDGDIGVDAESITSSFTPGPDLVKLGVLSATELAQILNNHDPQRTFLEHWTAKEAISKAIGCGLSMPFSDIVIHRTSASAANRCWQMQLEYPTPQHIVATAWDDLDTRIAFFCVEDEDIWQYLANHLSQI